MAFVLEDARVDSLQSPRVEERRPVDVLAECCERLVFDGADACEVWCGDVFCAPFDCRAASARLLNRDDSLLWRGMALAQRLVLRAMLRLKGLALLVAEQARRHGHSAACITDVHDRLAVMRCNLDRGVRAAGSCSADEQRNFELLALHLARDVHHLVERRRD